MSKTITFFKEIAKIPRESGNEEKIAKYLCEFAQKRNLEHYIDKYNNVYIKKNTSNKTPLILQAHTDMVCVSENPFDFVKNPIEIIEENGYIHANGTTLGADNGIGIAQILNILDSNIPCNIEAIFTVSEETTMIGAKNFDTSKITSKYLLNLDGFEENEIIKSSASYYDIELDGKINYQKSKYQNTYKISITGLQGGHSGYDIDKNRGNAIIILAELIKILNAEIVKIKGGTKNNVFPSQCFAIINTDENITIIDKFLQEKKSIYPNILITYQKTNYENNIINNKIISLILNIPSKALYYNKLNEVTTSLNLGVINNTHFEIGMRSSVKSEADEIINLLKNIAKQNNFNFNIVGFQPGFFSNDNSTLINNLIKTCPYPKKAKPKSLHITVEAGFFQEKIPNLEIAIISPEIKDAHSTNERVSINSIKMCDKWLEEFIKEFNKD